MKTVVAAVLTVVAGLGITACGDNDSDGNGKGENVSTTTQGLVCNMVDLDLVRKVIPSGDDIGTRGPGMRTKDQRQVEPSNCTVQDESRHTTVMQLRIGEVEAATWKHTLDTEAADDPDCTKRFTDDPGYGYGCLHSEGIYVNGASVNVVRGDRLIRVTVYNWTDATPAERLTLAEQIARNLDENLTAYDSAHS